MKKCRDYVSFYILSVAACSPQLPESAVVGKHVAIFSDPELELCGGSLEYMDQFITRLLQDYEIEISDRINFFWLNEDGFAERSGCNEIFAGCSVSNRVYSKKVPFNHELVHGVARSIGKPPPFFREGLAVAYQGLDDGYGGEFEMLEQDLLQLINLSGSELSAVTNGYRLAGAFIAYLIRQHGIQSYLDFYSIAESDDSNVDLNILFADIFGTSISQEIDVFNAGPKVCPPKTYDALLMECSAPELVWTAHRLEMNRLLSCEQDDAIGPFEGRTTVAHYTFEATEGLYELRFIGDSASGSDGNRLSVISCSGCMNHISTTIEPGSPPLTIKLLAGRYSLRVIGPSYKPTTVGVSVERVEP